MIGVWSDTERYSMQLAPGKATRVGEPVQVSRLGNPLVNEVVLPAGLKDAFNGLTPNKDATIPEVVARVTDPELPKLIEGIYGVPAPTGPRNDLVEIFLTGIAKNAPTLDGSPAPIQADLNSPVLNADADKSQIQPSEMLRLNTSIKPTGEDPNRLGVLGGDLQGFPNGRRLADDVIDISIQAVEGAAQTGKLVDALAAGDKVDANDVDFGTAVPVRRAAQQRDRGRRAWARRPRRGPGQRHRLELRGRLRRAPPAPAGDDDRAEVQPAAASSGWDDSTHADGDGRRGRRGAVRRAGCAVVPPPPRRGPRPAGLAEHRRGLIRPGGGPASGPPPGSTRPRPSTPDRTVMASSAPTVPGTDSIRPIPPTRPARAGAAGPARCWPRSPRCCWPRSWSPAWTTRGRDTPAGTPQPVPDRLAATIEQAQDRLRRLPDDAGTWAALGSAYVEQARVSANPAYYAQAQGALERSVAAAARRATPPPPSGWARWPTPGTTSPPPAATPSRRWRSTRPASRRTGCWPTRPPSSATPRPPPPPCSACSTCGPGWPRSPGRPTSWSCTAASTTPGSALQRALAAATSRDELAFSHYYLGELAWGGGEPGGGPRPVRARTRRRPGRPGAAAGPGQGARRRPAGSTRRSPPTTG